MEEIQYKKGLIYILTKWKYIFISIVLVAILSAILLPFLHKNTYIASVSIALSAADIESLDDNLKQNEQLVYNYNSLIKNNALLAEIIEKNGYDYSINEVKDMIESEIVEDTTIINIKVKNSEEIVATQILTDIIDKLREEAKNIYFVDNVYMVKNILVKNDENFNLPIMLVAVTALGGILTVGIFALYAYFKKIIMIEKDDNQILDTEIITKLKKRKKSVEILEAFNNIFLFLKKKNAKVIGFIGDKYCNNKENLIVELSKNVINNRNILIINYNHGKNSNINKFISKNKFYKNKLPLKFSDNIEKQEELENSVELLTNNNIDVLNFLENKIIMELAYEIENMELLKEFFEEYDYIFINLDNKITNTGTKVFSEICDTLLILNRNYKSKEDNLKGIKRFCKEKEIENIGVLFI